MELIDPRALQILSNAYWSAKGWKVPRDEPSAEDFEYAKAKGVMFDREPLTHDDAIERIVATKHLFDVCTVADAFIASLTSRAAHLRPPLASYYTVQQVNTHRFSGGPHCSICGQSKRWDHDFSDLNFARLKWGMMPRYYLVDHAFVLERFAVEPCPKASDQDRALMHGLLAAADAMTGGARARDLEQAWRPLIKSSRSERDEMIEIFIRCGVLVPSRTTSEDFDRIPLRSNWSDAAALWRGDDGVNREQAYRLFGWG